MKFGIGTKITASLILTAILVTLITASFGFIAVKNLFDSYVIKNERIKAVQWGNVFIQYYQLTGGWEGVQRIFEPQPRGTGRRRPEMSMPNYTGTHIILADSRGIIVADSLGINLGQPLEKKLLDNGLDIEINGLKIGTLVVDAPKPPGIATLEQSFLRSLTLYTFWGGVGAVVIAAFIGLFLSRRLTKPIITLSKASHYLAEGNLDYRLPPLGNDEIGRLAEDFNTMVERLQQNETLRKNLTADVAHELRTPITILMGTIESIQEGVLQPSPDVIMSLNDEVLRMSRIVTDLQNLGLAEVGQLPLDLKSTPVEEIIKRVSYFNLEAELRGINFKVELEQDLPEVYVDPQRIAQVISNLLQNALRYTPSGGSITLKGSRNGNEVLIQISDTGKGIKKQDLPYVFERFYRSEKSRSRKEGGMGLGLAIAKSFIHAHKGKIWVESEEGRGTTFFFTLPVK